MSERCFVCGARDWRLEPSSRAGDERHHRCSHCGVLVHLDRYRAGGLQALATRTVKPGPLDMGATSWRRAGVQADAFTTRILASAFGLGFEPAGREEAAALAHPHSAHPTKGWLVPFAPAPRRVALGMIVEVSDLDAVLERTARWAGHFREIVVAVDGDASLALPSRLNGVPLFVSFHPLAGDFAAQRNRVQRAATAPWVLQLDTDETPSDALLDAINALTARLDAQNVRSVGLPRRNLVDGALSDLYPDLQYRLNGRELRYRGRVHERPDLQGAWRRSTIAPSLSIDHHLTVERVRRRTQAYGAMADDGERRSDEAALLRAFRR